MVSRVCAAAVLLLLAAVAADTSLTAESQAGGADTEPADVYVLFDMEPGEGFNFRKKCLHRMLSFMRRFAEEHTDTRFAMVVPTFRNRRGVEEYPLGTFFDLDAFQGALPNRNARMLEVAGFVQEMAAAYDTLGHKWDNDGIIHGANSAPFHEVRVRYGLIQSEHGGTGHTFRSKGVQGRVTRTQLRHPCFNDVTQRLLISSPVAR